MFQISTEERYQDGQTIFAEGDGGDWIYVIESGSVEIFKKIGHQNVVLETLHPGEIFGEISYIAQIPRTAGARAAGSTIVGIIDRNFLDKEFYKLSGSFRLILKTLALRLTHVTETGMRPVAAKKDSRKIISLSFTSSESLGRAYTEQGEEREIFINTPYPFPKGEQFLLKLMLPDASEPLKIECEVKWVRTQADSQTQSPPGMGARFLELDPVDQEKLKRALPKM
jgi:CRP-like cAMP-binding protein